MKAKVWAITEASCPKQDWQVVARSQVLMCTCGLLLLVIRQIGPGLDKDSFTQQQIREEIDIKNTDCVMRVQLLDELRNKSDSRDSLYRRIPGVSRVVLVNKGLCR